jgi:hypothetical protein
MASTLPHRHQVLYAALHQLRREARAVREELLAVFAEYLRTYTQPTLVAGAGADASADERADAEHAADLALAVHVAHAAPREGDVDDDACTLALPGHTARLRRALYQLDAVERHACAGADAGAPPPPPRFGEHVDVVRAEVRALLDNLVRQVTALVMTS